MDTSQGIEALKRFAVQFQSLADLGAQLESVGSLEGQAKGAQDRLAEASAALALIEPQLAQAKADLAQAHADAESSAIAAADKATALLADADAKVADKLAAATVAADQMVADAKGKADALVQAGKDAKFQADQEAGSVRAQGEQAKRDLAQAQADLDALNDKIARAKAAMADMLK